jgi:hypothetical protein
MVSAFVEAHLRKLEEKQFLDVVELERELHRLAFFDPKSTYAENGITLSVPEMPEATRRALSGVEYSKDGIKLPAVWFDSRIVAVPASPGRAREHRLAVKENVTGDVHAS